jgi:hypothetical protein
VAGASALKPIRASVPSAQSYYVVDVCVRQGRLPAQARLRCD